MRNIDDDVKWTLVRSEQFSKGAKKWKKKRPRELAAVLHNLKRFFEMLEVSKNSMSVWAGSLHKEPNGIRAIDQKGGGQGLAETRLYVFALDSEKTLHVISIGDKNSQNSDIDYAKRYVRTLKNQK